MAKKRIGRYPKAFRKMAVERLKSCDNIVALSEELGVHRRLLYKWRDQLEPIDDGAAPPENSKERELRLQVTQLKRLVADKTLEADFFKGALQKSRLDAGAIRNLCGLCHRSCDLFVALAPISENPDKQRGIVQSRE